MLARELTHLTLMQGEEIEKLKADKETLEDICFDLTEKKMKIEQSRDELLKALKQISDRDCFDPPTLDYLIRNAEALKDSK